MDENFGWLFQLLAYFLAAFSSARRLVRATWASIRTLQMYVQSDGGHGATSTSEDAEEIEASLAEYLAIFSCNEASSVIKSRSQNTETAAVSQLFLGRSSAVSGRFSAVSWPFLGRFSAVLRPNAGAMGWLARQAAHSRPGSVYKGACIRGVHYERLTNPDSTFLPAPPSCCSLPCPDRARRAPRQPVGNGCQPPPPTPTEAAPTHLSGIPGPCGMGPHVSAGQPATLMVHAQT